MAKAPQDKSKSGDTGGAQTGKRQRSPMFYAFAMVFSILVCLLFYETVLLLAAGMLPTVVAYMVDTHPRRHATKTVAWMNLAGAMIVAFELWESGTSLSTAWDLLSDPFNWLIMLGGAGLGWVIHYAVPGLVLRYLDVDLNLRRKRLHETQEQLEKEWGKDVRANAALERLAEVEAGPAAQAGDADDESLADADGGPIEDPDDIDDARDGDPARAAGGQN